MRLIDGATAGPAPYSVGRSADLALGLFAVCGYRGVPGGAPAGLSSSTVAGTLQSGSPGTGGGGTATATVSLHVRVSRTPGRFVFSGICSKRSGRVSLQRNVARSQLRAGRYSFTRRAHKGERYRVALVGSKVRSGVVRFR